MDIQITTLFTAAVTAVLIAFGIFLLKLLADTARYFQDYFSAKIGEFNYKFFYNVARNTVLMLMQHPAYKDLLGEEKKAFAISKIAEALRAANIPITNEQVSEMIEAVYAEIKKSAPPVLEIKKVAGKLR